MLFEAHEALISSNAWLVQRLKAVEVREEEGLEIMKEAFLVSSPQRHDPIEDRLEAVSYLKKPRLKKIKDTFCKIQFVRFMLLN